MTIISNSFKVNFFVAGKLDNSPTTVSRKPVALKSIVICSITCLETMTNYDMNMNSLILTISFFFNYLKTFFQSFHTCVILLWKRLLSEDLSLFFIVNKSHIQLWKVAADLFNWYCLWLKFWNGIAFIQPASC